MDDDNWQISENSTKELILKYTVPGKILDVGVGLGRLLDLLPDSYEKYGMDISLNYLKHTKQKNIKVCMSLIEDMPYNDKYFDTIICTDVLEHVLDLNDALKNIFRVLKTNGILIIRVPYKENLIIYLDRKMPYKYVHLRNFDEYSLIILFEKIFNKEVLEFNFTSPYITRIVLKSYFPNIFKIVFFLAIYFLRKIKKSLFNKLANIFFPKTEINVVVKNINY